MKRNACLSFLDLEAGRSGRNRDCDYTKVDESQGSLVDFVDDVVYSGDNVEDDMTGIYIPDISYAHKPTT